MLGGGVSVKHMILVVVDREPAGAYALKQQIDNWTGGQWSVNIGQISQTLTRLERDGLVEIVGETASGARVAELYGITPAGLEELEAWWRTPLTKSDRDRDDLVMRVLAAMQSEKVDVSAVIQLQRKDTLRALAKATRELRQLDASDLASFMILQRRIFELDSESRWLDHIEQTVAKLARRKDRP